MVLATAKKTARLINISCRNFPLISSDTSHLQEAPSTAADVHLHVFYQQSSEHSLSQLKNLPAINKLIITGENSHLNKKILHLASEATNIGQINLITTRKGMKDTEVFIQIINEAVFSKTSVFLKIHSKSMKNKRSAMWAEHCVKETVPSSDECRQIIQQLENCARPAVAVPRSSIAGFETNAKFLSKIKKTTGKNVLQISNLIYPAGAMFWGNNQYLEHLRLMLDGWDNRYLLKENRRAEVIERLLFEGLNPNESIFTFREQWTSPCF